MSAARKRTPILAAALLFLGSTAFAAPTRIALLPLSSQGVSAEALQQIDAALRIELSRIENVDLVSPRPGIAQEGPCADAACLSGYGKAAGAHEVLHGEVRGLPDSFAVTLRLFDVAGGKEKGTATESVNRDVEEMVWATRAQVVRLKAPERYAGRLVLVSPPDEQSEVDGAAAGGAPLVLAPGSHAVKLSDPGKKVIEGWVDVRFAHTATARVADGRIEVEYSAWVPPPKVDFAIAPKPLAVPSSAVEKGKGKVERREERALWPAYAAFGAGGALVIGGMVQQIRAGAMEREIEGLRKPDTTFPESERARILSLLDQAAAARRVGWVFLGVGAALAVGGGVYLYVTGTGGQVSVAGSF
jgi:hypothetical protein